MKFKQPFYVSPHAVKRFKQRVANLPTRTVRIIIQAALQDNHQVVGVQIYNKRKCPLFRANFAGIEYIIPVMADRKKTDAWPVVPTILLPGMKTYELYERGGWNWRKS